MTKIAKLRKVIEFVNAEIGIYDAEKEEIYNLINEIETEQLRLNVVINWVACKDKLPNDGYVLIYEKGIGIRIVNYESKKNEFWHNSFYNPTHWAELPEAPCL